jgi:hypothetical protein
MKKIIILLAAAMLLFPIVSPAKTLEFKLTQAEIEMGWDSILWPELEKKLKAHYHLSLSAHRRQLKQIKCFTHAKSFLQPRKKRDIRVLQFNSQGKKRKSFVTCNKTEYDRKTLTGGDLFVVLSKGSKTKTTKKNHQTSNPKPEQKSPVVTKKSEKKSPVKKQKIAEYEQKATLEVENLLARAEKAEKAKKLTSPEEGSAVQLFKKVLELEPENKKASEGLERIADLYVKWGVAEVNKKQIMKAMEYMQKAQQVWRKVDISPLTNVMKKSSQQMLADQQKNLKAQQLRLKELREKQKRMREANK